MHDWVFNIVLFTYTLCRDKIAPATCEELIAARDEQLLGPRDMRTRECSTQNDGEWSGGVAWERDNCAVGVGKGGRCYTVAQSYEEPARLTGVTAAAKTYNGELGYHGKLRKRLNMVSSCACSSTVSYTL